MCARELGRELPPEGETAMKRAETIAIRTIAGRLHHTPATCRSYYIHPAIFRAYRSGDLYRRMNSPAPRLRKSDGSALLHTDERRVLAIIEANPIGHRRPSGTPSAKLEQVLRRSVEKNNRSHR